MNLQSCPRCGGEHLGLATRPFKNPVRVGDEVYEDWATCPTTNEPIIFHCQYGYLEEICRQEDRRWDEYMASTMREAKEATHNKGKAEALLNSIGLGEKT
jgi:hypothetical protein